MTVTCCGGSPAPVPRGVAGALPPEDSGKGETTYGVPISLDMHVKYTELSDTRKTRCLHVGFWQQGLCQQGLALRGSPSGGEAGQGLQEGLSPPDPVGLECILTRNVLSQGEPLAVWPHRGDGCLCG